MTRIITVTSGKGGVGKTNVSVNLAITLANNGHKTCLFDADLGLANVNILLGLYPEYNLEDVLEGKKRLSDIIIRDKSGIDIIPGSSGVGKMADLSEKDRKRLAHAFTELEAYDFFIFDTSAGISKNVISFCMSSSEVILVITPEPTALTDAYALMKVLTLNGLTKPPKVVVNQSKNAKTAQLAYAKLKDTTLKFLGIQIKPLGTVVADPRVLQAVASQKPFVSLYPNTQASRCIKSIAAHLLEATDAQATAFTLDTFWNKWFDILTAPIKMPQKKQDATSQKPAKATPEPVRKSEQKPVKQETVSQVPVAPTSEIASLIVKNQEMFANLTESVNSVSRELGAIRSFLEQINWNKMGQEGNRAEPQLIPLDFEAYLTDLEGKK